MNKIGILRTRQKLIGKNRNSGVEKYNKNSIHYKCSTADLSRQNTQSQT